MKLKPQFRTLEIREANKEKRTVELSFSSEEPYERFWGVEVLDHSLTSVKMERLNNSAPLLYNHDRDVVIGVIENASISNNRGVATVRFGNSEKAKEVFRDVEDGILKNVSVGYEIHEMKKESESDGVETYRVTSWLPLEISVVSIPADNSVGIGRSNDLTEKEVKILGEKVMKKEIETPKVEVKAETPKVDVKSIQEEARKSEQERIREISAIGEKFGQKELAGEAIQKGTDLNNFRDLILKGMNVNNEINTQKNAEIGMNESELKSYSFGKALRASITGDWKDAGLELEASRAVAKALGQESRGFYVPHDILKRDVTVGGTGTNIVATDTLAGSFIDMLRNKSALMGLGARTLTGLAGNVSIPKQTGGASAYWVDEAGNTTASDMTLSNIGLSPKTVSAKTGYSRQMLLQGNPSVDALVMSDLAMALSLEIDRAGVAGTGLSGQPTGILNTTGIGAVDTSTGMSYAKAVEFETAIKSQNADLSTLSYLTNASSAGLLKTREKVSGYPQYLLENGAMNGYGVAVSNQIADDTVLFGDFSQLIIALWGGLDIITDRDATNGSYIISGFQSVDFGVRHAESFSATINLA